MPDAKAVFTKLFSTLQLTEPQFKSVVVVFRNKVHAQKDMLRSIRMLNKCRSADPRATVHPVPQLGGSCGYILDVLLSALSLARNDCCTASVTRTCTKHVRVSCQFGRAAHTTLAASRECDSAHLIILTRG